MPSPPLFRAEAIAARQAQWLGAVHLARPLGFSVVTAVSLALAALLLGYVTWGEMTRKARLAGLLVPAAGSLAVNAQAMGTLARVAVAEGETVQAGDTLFVLSTDRASAQGDTAVLVAASLAQRKGALESERALRTLQNQQRQQALADRLRSLNAEIRQQAAERELLGRRVVLAQTSLARQQQLAGEGFVSAAQTQTKAEELIDLQSRAQGGERNQTALARDAASLQAEMAATHTQTQTELAQITRALAALGQEATENDSRRQLLVLAPQSGVVTALHAKPGQSIAPGQSLATMVGGCVAAGNNNGGQLRQAQQAHHAQHATGLTPGLSLTLASLAAPPAAVAAANSAAKLSAASAATACGPALEAQLFAPSRTAGFVQVGQTVMLRYAAFPYQKFGMHQGQITAISATPINPQDLPPGSQQALMQAAQSSEPLYRISVALHNQSITTYGQAQVLKPGMALDADVLQDRRAIWEWVLEPVLAARANAQVRL